MCFTTDPSFSEFLRLLNIHPHSYVLKILSCEHPLLPYITHHEIPGSSSSLSVMDALSVIENLLWLQNSLLFLTLAQSVNTRKEAYILLLLPHHICVLFFLTVVTLGSIWWAWVDMEISSGVDHVDQMCWLVTWSYQPLPHPPTRINNTVCFTPRIHT